MNIFKEILKWFASKVGKLKRFQIPERAFAHAYLGTALTIVFAGAVGWPLVTSALVGATASSLFIETLHVLSRMARDEGDIKTDNWIDLIERNGLWVLLPAFLPGAWGALVFVTFVAWYGVIYYYRNVKKVK